MILFLSLMVLLCGAYGIYMLNYNKKNADNQSVYDSLNETAWEEVSEDTAKDKVDKEDIESISKEQTTEVEAIDPEKKKFLDECGAPEYYETYLNKVPDMSEYLELNEDVVGYLLIPDTMISYPILQHATDNSFYLEHNIDGSKGYPGCIYIENCNQDNFSDPLTVIYGHNMKNNTMFGALDEYKEEEYREDHRYIFIYTSDQIKIYQVVVCSVYDDEHLLAHDFYKDEEGNWLFGGTSPDDQVQVYNKLKDFKAWNAYFDEEGLLEDDKCIALATCSGEGKRFIVLARNIVNIDY